MSLKGSKTEDNLKEAFAGESQANRRYLYFAQKADMQIGFNARFLVEMLNNLEAKEVQFEMSMPNRAGILTPMDGVDENEQVTMLVMPVMLNQ